MESFISLSMGISVFDKIIWSFVAIVAHYLASLVLLFLLTATRIWGARLYQQSSGFTKKFANVIKNWLITARGIVLLFLSLTVFALSWLLMVELFFLTPKIIAFSAGLAFTLFGIVFSVFYLEDRILPKYERWEEKWLEKN